MCSHQDWTHNLGMSPSQDSNLQHFGLWDDAPPKWATSAKAQVNFLTMYFSTDWSSLAKSEQTFLHLYFQFFLVSTKTASSHGVTATLNPPPQGCHISYLYFIKWASLQQTGASQTLGFGVTGNQWRAPCISVGLHFKFYLSFDFGFKVYMNICIAIKSRKRPFLFPCFWKQDQPLLSVLFIYLFCSKFIRSLGTTNELENV